MKIRMVVAVIPALLVLAGCSPSQAITPPVLDNKAGIIAPIDVKVQVGIPKPDVNIVIGNGSISIDSVIEIGNMYKGRTAEVHYQITNESDTAIRPVFYPNKWANIADYSESNGAVKVPDYIYDWITYPETKLLFPNESGNYTLSITIPADTTLEIPPKFGLQIGTAGESNAMIQVAIGGWWIVSMR